MSEFFGDQVFLPTPTARRLYHEHAVAAPIIDFHSHLAPSLLVEDRPFADLSALWIDGDPYKWRAMRINGVPEAVITGDAPPLERFRAWAATLPQLAGNPLYHWSHLELRHWFGIHEPLGAHNAESIFHAASERLADPAYRPRALLRRAGVAVVCSSDAWLDDLGEHRRAAAGAGAGTDAARLLPSLRADAALAVTAPGFPAWVDSLAAQAGHPIADLDGYRAALGRRLDAFAAAGGVVCDHSLDRVDLKPIAADQAAAVFRRCRAGAPVSAAEVAGLQAHLLRWLGGEYARRGWTLLLHLGALRDTSTRTAQTVGAAGGYAAMGPSLDVVPLCRLLDDLEEADHLPRTVLFPLNPGDTEMLATLAGSFRREGLPAAVQLGPAWWYNDHRDGIRRQLCAVANHGLLGRFIGMTTDARCLLSMLRHQYFRRIFCGLLGDWVEAGELPDDQALLAELIGAVCHDNAARQLGLSGQTEKAS